MSFKPTRRPSWSLRLLADSLRRQVLRTVPSGGRARHLRRRRYGGRSLGRGEHEGRPQALRERLRLVYEVPRGAGRGGYRLLRQHCLQRTLEGVMNFDSETIAFWYGDSKTIP